VNNYIANGATVSDFNLEAYTGKDYSPVYCWCFTSLLLL
jgi:hypothetical protein